MTGANTARPEEAELPLSPAEVGELLSSLGKAARAFQLYSSNNSVFQRFVGALTSAFAILRERETALELAVEENAFRWGEHTFTAGEGRDNLAFLFYKDGIRLISFLPGFDEEIEQFMQVIHQARNADPQGDDLLTLLWEREFIAFRYFYIDAPGEDGEPVVGEAKGGFDPIPTALLVAEISAALPASGALGIQAKPDGEAARLVQRPDMEETLYFLSDSELRKLQDEVDREWARDIKRDVISALLDRLQDGDVERRDEIIGILRQLLTILLSRGDLIPTGSIVRELESLLTNGDLAVTQREQVSLILDELSDPALLEQLIRLVDEGVVSPDTEELALFFRFLRPGALEVLLRAVESAQTQELKERVTSALDGLGAAHPAHLARLLDSDDATVVRGALRLGGRLRLQELVPRFAKLIAHPDPQVRLAVVDAAVANPTSHGLDAVQRALDDEDRDVRVAAARALGTLRYAPARARLEAVLQGSALRDADLTEKLAMFEAFATAAGPEGVGLLDKILNGRTLLGRRQPNELRACAATALGRIASPAARAALQKASGETDAVLRSAVSRALRQEQPPR
jgi:HEAT repeat protein